MFAGKHFLVGFKSIKWDKDNTPFYIYLISLLFLHLKLWLCIRRKLDKCVKKLHAKSSLKANIFAKLIFLTILTIDFKNKFCWICYFLRKTVTWKKESIKFIHFTKTNSAKFELIWPVDIAKSYAKQFWYFDKFYIFRHTLKHVFKKVNKFYCIFSIYN